MHRFYCPELVESLPADSTGEVLSDTVVTLDRDESHHARRVIRLAEGESVELFDGEGLVAGGVVAGLKPEVSVRLTSVRPPVSQAPQVTVASAIPKGPRADDMVNQLSQLGASRLVPLRCERGVVVPKAGRLARFRRAAIESAKQCGRDTLLQVGEPTGLAQVLDAAPTGLRLIAAPAAERVDDLPTRLVAVEHVLILVGPEGGWTDDELAVAKDHGCLVWPLGPHTLRIETAAAAAVAIIRYLAHLQPTPPNTAERA